MEGGVNFGELRFQIAYQRFVVSDDGLLRALPCACCAALLVRLPAAGTGCWCGRACLCRRYGLPVANPLLEASLEQARFAVFDYPELGCEPRNQAAVVGDEYQGAAVGLERGFKRLSAGNVQVRRRFVEDEHVRLGDEQTRKGEAAALAAAERGCGLEDIIASEEEAREVVSGFGNAQVARVYQGINDGRALRQANAALRVVARLDIVSEACSASDWRRLSQQRLYERSLADAVVADDSGVRTAFELRVGYGQELNAMPVLLVSDGELAGSDGNLAGTECADASEVDCVVGLWFVDALKALEASCAPTRFSRPLACAVSADERLFALDVLLLSLVLDELASLLFFLQSAVLGVVAGEGLEPAVVEFQYAVGTLSRK